jgi:hypothetical protein
MKRTLAGFVIAIVGVGAVGWHFLTTSKPVESPPPVVARPTVPKKPVVANPMLPKKPLQSPAPQPVVARPMLPKQRLAPEGTYFLLQRASFIADSTIVGFPPGTKVHMVKQDGSTSTVTDGEHDFDIPSSQLTNDLDIATRVAKSDLDAQRKIAELIAKSVQAHEKQQAEEIASLEKERIETEQRRLAGRAPNSRRP